MSFTQEQLDEAVEKAKAPLLLKNTELMDEVKDVKRKFKPFEGLDAAEIKATLAEAKELREKRLKDEGEYDKLRAQDKAAADAELAKVKAEKDEYRVREENAARKAAVVQAIQEAKIAAPFLDTIIPFFEAQAKIVGEGETRTVMIGDKTVKDFVTAYVATDKGKHYVQAENNSGGGAGGGGIPGFAGVNPFDKKAPNLTDQMKVMRENPKLAEQLKKAAGG